MMAAAAGISAVAPSSADVQQVECTERAKHFSCIVRRQCNPRFASAVKIATYHMLHKCPAGAKTFSAVHKQRMHKVCVILSSGSSNRRDKSIPMSYGIRLIKENSDRATTKETDNGLSKNDDGNANIKKK
jgi:hypothetical protein